MDRLGSVVVIAPAHRAGDPGSNPGPGDNCSLNLLIYIKLQLLQVHIQFKIENIT